MNEDERRQRVRQIIAADVAAAESHLLADFLLARIAEDEGGARDVAYEWLAHFWPHVDDDPDWEIAMVESWLDPARPDTPPAWREFSNLTERDLRWFAARYADHPDYREEWKP